MRGITPPIHLSEVAGLVALLLFGIFMYWLTDGRKEGIPYLIVIIGTCVYVFLKVFGRF